MTTVAVDDSGTIRGFATTCAARDADVPGYGELAAIHVDPDWWGRGVGVALLASARVPARFWIQASDPMGAGR